MVVDPPAPLPVVETHFGLRVLRWRSDHTGHPPLVLLHGMGDGADLWHATVAELFRHDPGEIIAIGLPGHWGSEWQADGHYTLEQSTALVASVIAAVTRGPLALVGHSLGARIAAVLASRHALALTALVLVDMSPESSDEGQDAVGAHIDALNTPPFEAKRLTEIATARLPFCAPDAVAAYLQGAVKALPCDAERAVDPSVLEIDMLLDGAPADFWQILESIRCPVGILRGAYSSLLTARVAHGAALSLRHCCGYHTIPRAGHAIPLEQPVLLARKIVQCLQEATSHKPGFS